MFALFTAASLLVACKGGDGGTSGAKATEGGKPAAVKLAKLGLQVDIAGEANVGDGIGDGSVMIQGGAVGALQVEAAKAPQTLEDAKSDASMFNGKNVKEEKLADGWLLTYDNSGSAGANFFVASSRTIGGKNYKCSTTVSDASQQAAAAAACKSLRP